MPEEGLQPERLGAHLGGERALERGASLRSGAALEERIELAEVGRLGRPLAGSFPVPERPVAEPPSGELLAPRPDPLAQVVPRDPESSQRSDAVR
jgi:hypothetical protein